MKQEFDPTKLFKSLEVNLDPVKLLLKLYGKVENTLHHFSSQCWCIIVEILGQYEGLTVSRYRDLTRECRSLVELYRKHAVKDPWDHLGELWNLLEIKGSVGQNLTPRNVVEMMTKMTVDDEPYTEVKTILDPCVGTGRFLLMPTMLYPDRPLELFGIEINLEWYRACLVNMHMFSNHPYHIICADTFMLKPLTNNEWERLSNQWNPPDMTRYYVKAEPKKPFSLSEYVETKAEMER